jgi:nucleoside-diphosphate-sugar epimerase
MNITLTGSTGFVGKNLLTYLKQHQIVVQRISRIQLQQIGTNDLLNTDAVVHLAGKAHDLKETANHDEYNKVNFELTKQLYKAFLQSNAKKFIFVSSVKAAADSLVTSLTEAHIANPETPYGKSKRMAEEYILSQPLPQDKSFYILRPCMIHGLGNKGNLNLLYQIVSKGLPWPLGAFDNKRSFCSLENLCFIIKDLIEREDIPSGIYNVADDDPLSTNQIIELIAGVRKNKPKIFNVPKQFIKTIAKIGDVLYLPLNTERLQKLTESYVVSNKKNKTALGKSLPLRSFDGLKITIESFKISK